MLGYVTVGTNDLKRAAAFYDVLLAEFGAKRIMEFDRFIIWGTGPESASFAIGTPYDEQPATVGNGVMIAFAAKDRDTVDRVYNKAMTLGGSDEGAVGLRGENFYAGYFRDLDGNKLNVFCMGA
jgi:catechol 2,3-dioxygenase-like lactoylglutathione lyase family enzyme